MKNKFALIAFIIAFLVGGNIYAIQKVTTLDTNKNVTNEKVETKKEEKKEEKKKKRKKRKKVYIKLLKINLLKGALDLWVLYCYA